jgi:GntR family transcriptional regulator, transcriptional repressor for pyruvate dehydrogenase complex
VKQENKSALKKGRLGHQLKSFETNANGEALPEKLAQRVLTLIREKELKAGDKLPPERELSAMLKVSRPSLREALHALKLMNIIENRQGSGTFVSSLTPEKLVEHLDIEFALDDSTYANLLQARTILEAGMVALAAENIGETEIYEIERCLDEAVKVIDDPEIFMACDIDLHRRIMEVAGNRIIKAFMHSIDRISIYSRRRTGDDMEVRRQAINDHREIVTALKAHDPDSARKAMIAHLSHVGKKFNLLSVS